MHTLFLEGFPRSFNILLKTVHNYNVICIVFVGDVEELIGVRLGKAFIL